MQSDCVEKETPNAGAGASDLIPLTRWAQEIGRTTSTIWRWRNLGWVSVINVAGKCYISRREIERFNARAAAGEFAKQPVVPQRVKEAVA